MSLLWSKDGIEYSVDDEVKIWCDDCKGCNKCCENMLDTIVLDPYDIWQFCHKLKVAGGGGVSFELLVSEDGPLELGNNFGVILPHMKMVETDKEDVGACSFLTEEGRCSIHFCRPGICRLYPLARNYEVDEETGIDTMSYIILNEELGCPREDTANITVKDWLGIEDSENYQAFLLKWHAVRKYVKTAAMSGRLDEDKLKKLQMTLLSIFFIKPYGKDFYKEFEERYLIWKEELQAFE